MLKIIILCFSMILFGGCYPGTWIDEMTYNGPALYKASLSHKGDKIAFFYAIKSQEKKGIYIADIYGKNPKLLVKADIDVHIPPIFTPDDKAIIYYTKHGQFCKVNINTREIISLSEQFNPSGEGRSQIRAVYFSRDCETIKFQKFFYNPFGLSSYRPSLFIFKVNKRKITPFLFPRKRYFEDAWGQLSPDATKVIFDYKNNLYAFNLNSKGVKIITSLKDENLNGEITKFSFSSDGKKIVYNTDKGIYIINIECMKSKLLFDFAGKNIYTYNLKFSPNGKYLFFNLIPRVFETPPKSGFYRLDLITGKLIMVTKAQPFYYTFTPDGKNILYRTIGYKMIDIDGKNKREVPLRPMSSSCPKNKDTELKKN